MLTIRKLAQTFRRQYSLIIGALSLVIVLIGAIAAFTAYLKATQIDNSARAARSLATMLADETDRSIQSVSLIIARVAARLEAAGVDTPSSLDQAAGAVEFRAFLNDRVAEDASLDTHLCGQRDGTGVRPGGVSPHDHGHPRLGSGAGAAGGRAGRDLPVFAVPQPRHRRLATQPDKASVGEERRISRRRQRGDQPLLVQRSSRQARARRARLAVRHPGRRRNHRLLSDAGTEPRLRNRRNAFVHEFHLGEAQRHDASGQRRRPVSNGCLRW